jgi:hypothetical protein
MKACLFLAIVLSLTVLLRAQELEPAYDLSKAPGPEDGTVDALIYGAAPSHRLGATSMTGDLKGDGLGALIVTAPGASVGSPARSAAGAGYV